MISHTLELWKGKLMRAEMKYPKFGQFSRAVQIDFFPKFGMGNVSDLAKTVLNLQVCGFTPATPRTLSIKVVNVIVVLYK